MVLLCPRVPYIGRRQRVQIEPICQRARSVPERGRPSGHSEAATDNANGS